MKPPDIVNLDSPRRAVGKSAISCRRRDAPKWSRRNLVGQGIFRINTVPNDRRFFAPPAFSDASSETDGSCRISTC